VASGSDGEQHSIVYATREEACMWAVKVAEA
jgi:hypothetical protein